MSERELFTITKKDIRQGTEITGPGEGSRRFVAVILDEEEFKEAKRQWIQKNNDRQHSVKELTVDDILEDYTEQLLERADWTGALYDIIDSFADLHDSKERDDKDE